MDYGRDYPDPLAAQAPSGFVAEPIPLFSKGVLPAFPVMALPESVRLMVLAVSEMTQTEPGMAATSCLGVLAGAVGGRVVMQVRPGWSEGLNLFTATVAAPGERKSAVQSAMSAPLTEAERQLVATVSVEMRDAETRRQIADKAADRARATASSARGESLDEAIAEAIAAVLAAGIYVPVLPRLLADDVTPEALASLLVEQAGRIAVVSAEGGIFDILAGRYSNVPSLDVFLKGHVGDSLRVDRKGRPPEFVARPALTMSLMIQPQVLAAIGTNVAFRGRGLLARFLYCQPVSLMGKRKAGAEGVPDDVSSAYSEFVRNLVLDFAGWKDPAVLLLDDDAHSAVIALEREIEPQLVGNGELALIADWGAKYVGAVCRISGLLHLAEHGAEAYRLPVTVSTLANAIAIGDYYKKHTVGAFVETRIDQATRDADYLLALVRRIGQPEVSARDLFSRVYRGRFGKTVDLVAPIQILVDHGWLLPVDTEPRNGPGRPPGQRWAVHPSAVSAESAES